MNKKKAKEFAQRWKDIGEEKQHAQQFLTDFAQNVLEIDPLIFDFEKRSAKATRGNDFIDAYINQGPKKRTIIEMKSKGISLDKKTRQSDGRMATPFEQALNYNIQLARREMAEWIITSNFQEFWIYDLNRTGKARFEPIVRISLDQIWEYPNAFDMLTPGEAETVLDEIHHEEAVSIKATEYLSKIYAHLEKAYKKAEPEVDRSEDLNKLAVRLVFLLYAEDAGLLIHEDQQTDFWNYIKDKEPNQIRQALIHLFEVLNTPVNERSPYLADDDPMLAAMPYVNGGLFKDQIIVPGFTEKMKETLKKASLDFDWSNGLSPVIFGSLFESTLNPETRHASGMHYTSVENIHKVIDPLFLNDLNEEFEQIKRLEKRGNRVSRVAQFRQKLGSLKFLDPAMGSGNFLTETFLSLRRLENDALKLVAGDQLALDVGQIAVTIDQFYGIEINDFAVAVANVALVLAEHQMMKETEKIIQQELEFLPLRSHTGLHLGNALRMNWDEIISASDLSFIIGNPPWLGYSLQNEDQKMDLLSVVLDKRGNPVKGAGNLDFVSGWFYKAGKFIDKNIRCAFVATNSISQGEQASILWKALIEDYGIKFNFAYQPFVWESEAKDKANVHCVIVGFSKDNRGNKILYFPDETEKKVDFINAHLSNEPMIFIEERRNPLWDVEKMQLGVDLTDYGYLNFTPEERDQFIKEEPASAPLFKRYLDAKGFTHNKLRYYLDLRNVSNFKNLPLSKKRIEAVAQARRNAKSKATQKRASRPLEPKQGWMPDSDYLLIPRHTSSKRKYIPIGFMDKNTIATMANQVIPQASLFEFGILQSRLHNIWVAAVAGRIKSDYRYGGGLVYNNFPWPELTDKQKEEIKKTAQQILDARELYPDRSLNEMYAPLNMPKELRKAHEANDRAVMRAYGIKTSATDREVLLCLFEMYQQKVGNI